MVFESVVDHVIIGGYDENGDKDPEMISFVYKTGFRDTLDGGMCRKPRKVRVDKKTGVKGLASPSQDNAMEKLCTLSEDDARGDVGRFTEKIKNPNNGGRFYDKEVKLANKIDGEKSFQR